MDKLFLKVTEKTARANLMKPHRKIKHNQKLCCTQDLGTHFTVNALFRGIAVEPGFKVRFSYKCSREFDETSQIDKA